jgi:hypothetical protein
MPSATRIVDRLPSLYRPEVDAVGLFTAFVRAVGSGLDGVSRESSDVMQAHWFSSADSALFSEWVRRTRELTGEPPVRLTDDIVEALPYLIDLPRLAALFDRAPWLDPPLSRDRVEDFRRRLADLVTMYGLGLGTMTALRLATRIALPVSDREAPPGLRTRAFTVEEFAPLRVTTQAVQARGQPLDMVGPLMQWAIASGSYYPALPTAFIVGVTPVPGLIDATERPVLERVRVNDNTGVGLAYEGTLAPSQALALWPAYRSWLGTENGVDVAMSSADAESSANPTAPGPWAAAGAGPAGTVVAFFQSADHVLWAAANDASEGKLWRTDDGTAWQEVLNGLPEIHCLAGRGNQLLIGLATGVTALELYSPGATPSPDPATLAGPGVHALAPDAAAQWWAATSDGAAQVGSDLTLTMVGPGVRPATVTPFHAVFVDVDGSVFFGGELGVFQFQATQGRWFHYGGAAVDEASPDWIPFDPDSDELPGVDTVFMPLVRSLRRGADAALWLGTDNGIARYLAREHRRTFATLLEAFPAVTQEPVHAIAEDERGRLWFATAAGLIVFDGADWWQRRETELVRLRSEPTVLPSLERNGGELTFWRFVRSANRWQSLTPSGTARFVTNDPPASATAEPPVHAVTWTDGVNPQLGGFDGTTFTPSEDAPAAVGMRFKPDAVRILDGGIPALPRLLAASDWRYLSIEPEVVPQPLAFPAWTIEGRMLPEPHEGGAPLEGRYLADLVQELRDKVFAFNPAAQVWMRWSPRELLSVLVRLRRTTPDEVVDPLVLDRVFDEVSRVRPAAVHLGLAVDEQLVRVE